MASIIASVRTPVAEWWSTGSLTEITWTPRRRRSALFRALSSRFLANRLYFHTSFPVGSLRRTWRA